jgi:uncharacterized protein
LTISLQDGTSLVESARRAIEASLGVNRGPAALVGGLFSEKRGVFVTLNKETGGTPALRGCIGFPYPVVPLGKGVASAAVAAATEDPRFPPVTAREMALLLIEVSVLTVPARIDGGNRAELPSRVRIGADGLVVSSGRWSGLLLPQVATEYRLGPEAFLTETCVKAGLAPDSWLEPETTVQSFQAEIFAEESPAGAVRRVALRGPRS